MVEPLTVILRVEGLTVTRGTIAGELVGQDGKTYHVQLIVELEPLYVNEEAAAVSDTLKSEQLIPGQAIPDGNYTRRPHQFDRQEKRVHVMGGKMRPGWRGAR